MLFGDTIAAIATAPGRGGVAVVRVSGPDAFRVAERLTGRPPEPGRVGLRAIGAGKIDEAVVIFFKSPRSYTGEDVVEFQCHGGAVTPRRVLDACLAAGARLARRGEFTQRAFLNGKLDYDQAESVLDLVDAKTARAADAALEGLAGRKRRALKALYEEALDLSTRLEHALDVDEDELADEYVRQLGSQISDFRSQIERAIRKAGEGKILREGALVVLAGPPNAGKSSLMNALLEENRAIVSDVPGTTRDSIEEWLDLDGWPIRLVDTAGLRESEDEIEAEGVRRAQDLVAKADVVVLLRTLNPQPTTHNPQPSTLNPQPTTLLIHPKCDLGHGEGLNVSAKTGEGLEELKRAIVAKLKAKAAAADAGGAPEADVVALREALAQLSPAAPAVSTGTDNIDKTDAGLLDPLDPTETAPPTTNHQPPTDLVLLANAVRAAAERLGALVGATYSQDLLDNLFSRFCVGK